MSESIRAMLTSLKFNWPAGRIIIEVPTSREFYTSGTLSFGEEKHALTDLGTDDHEVLDVEIETGGYGSCNIPAMVAEDDAALYIVVTYDGSSWLHRVEKNLDRYLEPGGPRPRAVGGG